MSDYLVAFIDDETTPLANCALQTDDKVLKDDSRNAAYQRGDRVAVLITYRNHDTQHSVLPVRNLCRANVWRAPRQRVRHRRLFQRSQDNFFTVISAWIVSDNLTGSIDAVLRSETGPTARYLVVDYKTNRFPTTQDEPLRVAHYHAAAMAEAMMQSHYPLQALLYGAALHRYLSWRLPGYQPERDLAGVGYLFVRGMGGPTTPTAGSMPAGVFTWRPPAALFVAASEILGGGS